MIETNIYNRTNEVVLCISDDHKWGENDRVHLAAILREIKVYVSSFISGEIYFGYPDAKSKSRVIEIVSKYPPNTEAKKILGLLGKSSEFSFRFNSN
ncbi:MAG: DUF6572 domain-containing protein [Arenicella sp.]